MRIAPTLILIALTFSVHLASDGSPQTPISFEIARLNPLAILMFVAIGVLLARNMYDFWIADSLIASLTTLPILLALPGIALTSPESTIHLKIFAFAASYGIIWIAAISFTQERYIVALSSFVFAIASIVFLFGFGIMKYLGANLPDQTPVGLFQKVLIVLFALLCLKPRPQTHRGNPG